jgi:hypothetical protein
MFRFLTRRLWLLVFVAFAVQIAAWIYIIRASRNPGTRALPPATPPAASPAAAPAPSPAADR